MNVKRIYREFRRKQKSYLKCYRLGGKLTPTVEITRKEMYNEWVWKGYSYHWLSLKQDKPAAE